jgi:hypothetical protein
MCINARIMGVVAFFEYKNAIHLVRQNDYRANHYEG